MILGTTVDVNWASFGSNLFLAFIGALTAWSAWKQKRTAKVVEETAVVMEKVHKLTNSNLGETLLTSLIAAQALAITENTPANIELARLAKGKYETHQAQQRLVDSKA